MAALLWVVCVDDTPTLKREKIRVGNGEKILAITIIWPHCQIESSILQVNLIYMPYLFISSRPISSNFLLDSSYPKCRQSYCVLNVSGQGCGGIQSPATLEQIIKLINIFIDNPIKSPIYGLLK